LKTKAIVINSVKYQDKALIVKCLTFSDGLKSYFVRDAFSSSKKKSKKSAYFQPFTMLEIEANHRNKNSLDYFINVKPLVYASIPNDIIKSSFVLFLSEVLGVALKEEGKNEDLFLFLEAALLWLDENPVNVNFHLVFLLETTKFLGFYPSASEACFFDMSEGVFTDFESKNCASKQESLLFKQLLKQKINTSENPFSNIQRKLVLEIVLDYYSRHIENFKRPKSLEVLKEVFT